MAGKSVFKNSAITENPVLYQILGICSTLAVTNLMLNSLIMGLGLTFALMLSSFTISLLKDATPRSVRMITQVLIIAAWVIVVDILLRAYLPTVSKQLGPYVGLIITNCILMGRAEAFAAKNPPFAAMIDGLGAGVGYTLVLLFIAFFRELLGFGSLFGIPVLAQSCTRWVIMVMAPSAFFMIAGMIWIVRGPMAARTKK